VHVKEAQEWWADDPEYVFEEYWAELIVMASRISDLGAVEDP
jgi:hypothetical protein